ncbi:hypothetical protein P3T76_003074 [Phytophthora citrophthora]|uniref:Uncharacterized protein n=1 Tax=Phytophthora citrophthora TaxID=4793 RepID=A0AAD9LRK0_9STRA|nr:hypothetical protein P3T76_003074 [Phytophthora citrophthora]
MKMTRTPSAFSRQANWCSRLCRREYRRYYEQYFLLDETRGSVLAAHKEQLLPAYQTAGVV